MDFMQCADVGGGDVRSTSPGRKLMDAAQLVKKSGVAGTTHVAFGPPT